MPHRAYRIPQPCLLAAAFKPRLQTTARAAQITKSAITELQIVPLNI